MNNRSKAKCTLVVAVIYSIIGYVVAHAALYDDFSSGTLDTNRWIERRGSDLTTNLLPEHFVTNALYHTASSDFADRGVALQFRNLTFSLGDTIGYDVNYLAGAGNRRSFIRIDEYASDLSIYGLFGFWNGLPQGGVGNDFGKYHVALTFESNGIYAEITVPSGEIRTKQMPYPILGIQEHKLEFGTRTGSNGTVHMDYDNVYIIPEPTTCALAGFGVLALLGIRWARRR